MALWWGATMVLTLEETLKAVKKFQNLVEHVHRPGKIKDCSGVSMVFFWSKNANECQLWMNLKRFIGYLRLPPHFLEEMKKRQFIIVDLSSQITLSRINPSGYSKGYQNQGCRQKFLDFGKTRRLPAPKRPKGSVERTLQRWNTNRSMDREARRADWPMDGWEGGFFSLRGPPGGLGIPWG